MTSQTLPPKADVKLSVFDDQDALVALAAESFHEAAKAAVAENDRLGIITHGAVAGEMVTREPEPRRKSMAAQR